MRELVRRGDGMAITTESENGRVKAVRIDQMQIPLIASANIVRICAC